MPYRAQGRLYFARTQHHKIIRVTDDARFQLPEVGIDNLGLALMERVRYFIDRIVGGFLWPEPVGVRTEIRFKFERGAAQRIARVRIRRSAR